MQTNTKPVPMRAISRPPMRIACGPRVGVHRRLDLTGERDESAVGSRGDGEASYPWAREPEGRTWIFHANPARPSQARRGVDATTVMARQGGALEYARSDAKIPLTWI